MKRARMVSVLLIRHVLDPGWSCSPVPGVLAGRARLGDVLRRHEVVSAPDQVLEDGEVDGRE